MLVSSVGSFFSYVNGRSHEPKLFTRLLSSVRTVHVTDRLIQMFKKFHSLGSLFPSLKKPQCLMCANFRYVIFLYVHTVQMD